MVVLYCVGVMCAYNFYDALVTTMSTSLRDAMRKLYYCSRISSAVFACIITKEIKYSDAYDDTIADLIMQHYNPTTKDIFTFKDLLNLKQHYGNPGEYFRYVCQEYSAEYPLSAEVQMSEDGRLVRMYGQFYGEEFDKYTVQSILIKDDESTDSDEASETNKADEADDDVDSCDDAYYRLIMGPDSDSDPENHLPEHFDEYHDYDS